jgi:hypothetical protein
MPHAESGLNSDRAPSVRLKEGTRRILETIGKGESGRDALASEGLPASSGLKKILQQGADYPKPPAVSAIRVTEGSYGGSFHWATPAG